MTSRLRGDGVVVALVLPWALFACDADVTTIGAWTPAVLRDAGRGRDSGPRDAGIDAGKSGQYFEAEDGELTGGFLVEQAAEASAGAALLAPSDVAPDADAAPGPARARFAFSIERAGSYAIWGRVYARGTEDNRFWFQLDGGEWIKWRISTGETWFWDDFHRDRDYGEALSFELAAGAHELVMASCVPGARLDRLYVTDSEDEPPGNDTPCRPPHTIEVAGECLPSCGVLEGTRCGPGCAGFEPLPAYDCDVCCRVEP